MKKKVLTSVSILLALGALFAYGIFYLFYDLQRIKGQEILSTIPSPDGVYTLTTYRNNGGATTPYGILVTATHNSSKREKNIYWNDAYENAEILWENETVAVINRVRLDIRKDSYDFRRS